MAPVTLGEVYRGAASRDPQSASPRCASARSRRALGLSIGADLGMWSLAIGTGIGHIRLCKEHSCVYIYMYMYIFISLLTYFCMYLDTYIYIYI